MGFNKGFVLDKIANAKEFTLADAKELSVLLSNESLQKAMACLLQSASERDILSSCDLGTQEGLAQARETIGVVRGLRLAVDELLDLCDFNEDEENGE